MEPPWDGHPDRLCLPDGKRKAQALESFFSYAQLSRLQHIWCMGKIMPAFPILLGIFKDKCRQGFNISKEGWPLYSCISQSQTMWGLLPTQGTVPAARAIPRECWSAPSTPSSWEMDVSVLKRDIKDVSQYLCQWDFLVYAFGCPQ
jgi:hypothetical protein